jgi:hypothetical protein
MSNTINNKANNKNKEKDVWDDYNNSDDDNDDAGFNKIPSIKSTTITTAAVVK